MNELRSIAVATAMVYEAMYNKLVPGIFFRLTWSILLLVATSCLALISGRYHWHMVGKAT